MSTMTIEPIEKKRADRVRELRARLAGALWEARQHFGSTATDSELVNYLTGSLAEWVLFKLEPLDTLKEVQP